MGDAPCALHLDWRYQSSKILKVLTVCICHDNTFGKCVPTGPGNYVISQILLFVKRRIGVFTFLSFMMLSVNAELNSTCS